MKQDKILALAFGIAVLATNAWSATTHAQATVETAPAAEPAPAPTPAPIPVAVTPTPSPEPTPAAQPTGPSIDMPADAEPVPAAPTTDVDTQQAQHDERERELTRGLAPSRMAQKSTVIGGYGQLNLNSLRVGSNADFDTTANVRRIVLFLAHHLNDDIQVYTEFEWENALACGSCGGSAEIEQAFLQWDLIGDALALRAGLVLVPMGIINEWHEPPVFHGVERPETETLIIPSTWRELGVGIAGTLAEIYRYQLYVTTTLDPAQLGSGGILGSSHLGSLARADAFAVTGRFEVEPWLGVIAGVGFFASDTGANADFFTRKGKARDLSLPVIGYDIDARARRFGFEARVLWTQFFLPNSGDLMTAMHDDGSLFFPNAAVSGAVPERTQGGYIELAYDVLHTVDTSHELLGFVRLETYDTQAAVPKGFTRLPALDVDVMTAGLTYRPISQLAFKTDLQLRDRRLGYDELQLNAGFGYMF